MLKPVATLRTLTLLFACALAANASAADITFTMTGSSPYCAGASISLNYDGSGNTFNSGNLFSAQLSDASGSFVSAVEIGSLSSTSTTGTISVTFPGGASGTGYKIRIVSNNPSIVGSAGSIFAISQSIAPTISIAADPTTTIGLGSVVYFSSTVTNAGGAPVIQWQKNGVNTTTGSAYVLSSAAVGDQISATLTSNLSCANPATANSNTITVDVDNNLTKTNHAWEARNTQSVSSVFVERSNASGFSIGTKAYIGLGSTPSNQYRNDFWEYDPQTDTWTQKANFPGPGRYNAVGFAIGSKGFMGTGMTATGVSKDFYEYSSINNMWMTRDPIPGLAREQAFAFALSNGTGILGGGVASGTDFKDVWEFNSGDNIWRPKNDFGGGKRLGSATFAVDAVGYVVGGYSTTTSTYYNDLWMFDGTNWTQKTSMPGNGRTRASAFTLAGNGYAGLGYSATGYEGQFYQYNVSADTWTLKPYYPGPTSLTFGTGISVGNRAYIYKDGTWTEYNLFTLESFASKLCTTETININYDASGFAFGVNNAFTAQISPQSNFSVSTTLSTKLSTSPNGSITVTMPTSANGTYYFRITASNPVMTTLLETITVTNLPASHTVSPSTGLTVCFGTPVTFTSNLTGTPFEWYKNDVQVAGSTSSYVDTGLVNGDKIKAVRVYTAGCKNPVGVASTPVEMVVRTPATPVITVEQPNILRATSFASYQWYKDGAAIARATNQTYQMTESGTYQVRVMDSNGCTASSAEVSNVFTGVEDDAFKADVLAYPSPFGNDLFLSVSDYVVSQGCDFTLLNELGQTVVNSQRAAKVNKLDLSGRAPGLYFLRVSFGKNIVVRKLLKVSP